MLTKQPKKIGVMGSAFDPVHYGHINVIEQACCLFDEIIIVPSISHAFGKKMTVYDKRIEMIEMALSESCAELIDSGKIRLSRIESELFAEKGATKPVYTYDVMERLEKQYRAGGAEPQLSFIVGPDNAEGWDRFYRSDEIVKRWGITVAEERVPVRSSMIRALVKKQMDGFYRELVSCVGRRVARFIIDNGLYQE